MLKNQFESRTVGAVASALVVSLTPAALAGDCVPHWDHAFNSEVGTNSLIAELAVFDGALYAGGFFTDVGNHVAKWDGLSWSPLGEGVGGGAGSVVVTLAEFDDGGGPAIYAGGHFTTAGGETVNNVARWDGSSWSALGGGLEGVTVYALAVFDDGSGPALFAGGTIDAPGEGIAHISKWNGSTWSEISGDLDGEFIYALTVFDDGSGPALIAGGNFTAGGVHDRGIAKWDGSSWFPLSGGAGMHTIIDMAVFDDGLGGGPALYVGGNFTSAWNVLDLNNIAKWDGSTWSALGDGLGGTANVLTVFDDGSGPALYAAGLFESAGGQIANRIARWTGTSWSPLGSGIGLPGVLALAVFDDGFGSAGGSALYAGGLFSTVDDGAAGNIARWQGCPIRGACCVNGFAIQTFGAECDAVGGVFHGEGASSDSVECEPGVESCFGDLNGDGVVDVHDLLLLIQSKGPCPE